MLGAFCSAKLSDFFCFLLIEKATCFYKNYYLCIVVQDRYFYLFTTIIILLSVTFIFLYYQPNYFFKQ
jgi:hypothetical protein